MVWSDTLSDFIFTVGQYGLYFMVHCFCKHLKYNIINLYYTHAIRVMVCADTTIDPMEIVGQCDVYFMVQ